ncbi:hypothetical protein RIF29_38266 [Crotalaria pallida]|uniref:Uncharacterized protein n=1 Tax=Crotalaria pallida TaxID=3830 RepID=A0AAN9DYW1_CROPI
MGGERIEQVSEEQIEKAFSLAWRHKSSDRPYHLEKFAKNNEVVISFPASGSIKDWYSGTALGDTKVNLKLFPSLRSIGNNEAAFVDKAIGKQKQIVFTGHSLGAPLAILATLWTLDKYLTPKSHGGIHPLGITFGSPLIGNHILSHATWRENWSSYFLHFVMRYDVVPRIFFSPLSAFDQRFEAISQLFNPKSNRSFTSESIGRDAAISEFYFSVMSNAAAVTSHAACKQMGSIDATLETVTNFIPLSPYRPFGTFIFCTGNGKEGKKIVVRNPDAVLQLLFRPVADPSSKNDLTLNDLDFSISARLCLQAATLIKEGKRNNEVRMKKKIDFVEEKMKELDKYKETWEHHKLGYYDAFKIQEDPDEDFQANVKRLELAAVWDEIIELLRRYDLPDELEGKTEWIKIGTSFRRLVEPLDISNYYAI